MSGKWIETNRQQVLAPSQFLETAILQIAINTKLSANAWLCDCYLDQDALEQEPQGDLLPEKLSIRQYLDEKLMPTLLPALNELAKEK